jgi:hypothetical protein
MMRTRRGVSSAVTPICVTGLLGGAHEMASEIGFSRRETEPVTKNARIPVSSPN